MIEKGNCIPKTSCNESSNEELKWNEGRRIIYLGVLADGLEKCSDKECIMPLSLKNIERETKLGLSSILWVRCVCGELNSVATSKTHGKKQKGRPLYDVI